MRADSTKQNMKTERYFLKVKSRDKNVQFPNLYLTKESEIAYSKQENAVKQLESIEAKRKVEIDAKTKKGESSESIFDKYQPEIDELINIIHQNPQIVKMVGEVFEVSSKARQLEILASGLAVIAEEWEFTGSNI